jgi:HAD superfamily hydrolase (TIGR01509 family)
MDWDLIIFDCDGVLVNSEPIGNRLIAEALTEAGLPMSSDGALYEFLGGKLTLIKIGAEEKLGRKLPDDWVAKIYEKQFEAFHRELEKIPGIDGVLDAIEAASVPMCVGSNGPPNKMEVSLGITGLYPRFDGRIYSADHVGVAKPAPDLYLYCAEKMGVDPARCVVVEDSPRGATAGVSAGMTVFGFGADSDVDKLRAVGCTEVFMEMSELVGLLTGQA